MRKVSIVKKGKDKKGKPQLRIRYFDEKGDHLIMVRPNTQAAAEMLRRKIEAQLLQPVVEERKVIGLMELFDQMIRFRRDIKAPTQKKYTIDFNHFYTFMSDNFPSTVKNLAKVDKRHINEYMDHAHTKSGRSKNTVNKSLIPVSVLFNYAIEEGYIDSNPVKGVKRFKVNENIEKEYYDKDELEAIWKNLNPKWLPFLQSLYYTGTRISELINLTWNDVNLDDERGSIRIIPRDDYDTKTGEKRTIPLHSIVKAHIEAQKGIHKKFVFTGPRSKEKIDEKQPRIALKEACKKAGIPGKNTPHKLRHSFASNLAINNHPIEKIGELLGHKDLQSTKIYQHLSTNSLTDAIDSL